jgi:hypothetical protein
MHNSYAKKQLDIYNQLMYYLFNIIGRSKRLLDMHEKWVVECVWSMRKGLMQESTHNIRENKIFTLRAKCKEKEGNVSLESNFTSLLVIASLFLLHK